MDKKAVRKIAKGMFQLVFLVNDKEIEQRWEHLQSSVKGQWDDKAESLIEIFEKLGYRKIKDKPRLLSDEGIANASGHSLFFMKVPCNHNRMEELKLVAQAQWDIWNEWYEGK